MYLDGRRSRDARHCSGTSARRCARLSCSRSFNSPVSSSGLPSKEPRARASGNHATTDSVPRGQLSPSRNTFASLRFSSAAGSRSPSEGRRSRCFGDRGGRSPRRPRDSTAADQRRGVRLAMRPRSRPKHTARSVVSRSPRTGPSSKESFQRGALVQRRRADACWSTRVKRSSSSWWCSWKTTCAFTRCAFPPGSRRVMRRPATRVATSVHSPRRASRSEKKPADGRATRDPFDRAAAEGPAPTLPTVLTSISVVLRKTAPPASLSVSMAAKVPLRKTHVAGTRVQSVCSSAQTTSPR
mmetsp:Transcript_2233/g.6650  ORF Transcript_2233/g.6650 Transcript_2233/m.6650 type:complete len:298 (-) Transcript_2233:289-1182(-)